MQRVETASVKFQILAFTTSPLLCEKVFAIHALRARLGVTKRPRYPV